ncbi:MAG: ParB/RepB/Spo0J family partition protein [Gemmobacter sp.]
MTRRRIFDVDLPEDDAPPVPPAAPLRRGPMATAIGETAESLRRRQEAEAAIRAENDALAHEFVRLKKLGLITDRIPLDRIDTTKLIRDRSRRGDDEIEELKLSIREVGLSNPIRVEGAPGGRFELIQGWRRLSAYRSLHAETGAEEYAAIPAALVAPGETLESLYRRMIDENLIRKDVSFAEMATLARAYADDAGVTVDEAINAMFASATPQKRSYIRRFATLTRMLEKVLEHPEAIPRALGMQLSLRLEEEPGLSAAVAQALRQVPRRSAEEEVAILRRMLDGAGEEGAKRPARQGRGRPRRLGKTVLRLPHGGGEVRCTAAPGRLELRLDRDLSALSRDRLEAAVEAFLRALD